MPAIIKVGIKKTGMHFFDRKVIKTNWRKMNQGPYHRAGMLVRRISRGSIKRRTGSKSKLKRKPSPIGQPPRSWITGSTPPFKMIFSLPTHKGLTGGQIVGMVGFGGGNPVPGLHEHGGFARRRTFVKIPGDTMEVTRNRKGQFSKAQPRDASGRFRKARKDQMKVKTRQVRYAKRPFMEPALMKAKSTLPQFWAGSLNKVAR